MKRFSAILAVVLCAALLCVPVYGAEPVTAVPISAEVARDGGPGALELYNNAMKALEDAKSTEYEFDMVMTLSAGGESMEATADGLVRQVNTRERTEMSMLFDMDMLGMTIEANMYYKDGWFYQNVDGDKTKFKMPLDELTKEMESLLQMDMNLMTEEWLAGATVDAVTNGTRIRFTIDMEDLLEMMGAMMGDMYGDVNLMEEIGVSFSDITYTILLDNDGNFHSQKVHFAMTVDSEGEEMALTCLLNMKLKSVDTYHRIPMPSDLNRYKTVSSGF